MDLASLCPRLLTAESRYESTRHAEDYALVDSAMQEVRQLVLLDPSGELERQADVYMHAIKEWRRTGSQQSKAELSRAGDELSRLLTKAAMPGLF